MPSVSSVDICNMALIKLGLLPVVSLDEGSKKANYCKRLYPRMLQDVLRRAHWNFAESQISLSPLSESPAFGFAYAYQLPPDCLKVRRLSDRQAAYRVAGRRLFTSENPAQLIYTRDVEDPTLFDPLFVNALATRLSAELAVPLTGSRTAAQTAWAAWLQALSGAESADAGEGGINPVDDNPWLKARW